MRLYPGKIFFVILLFLFSTNTISAQTPRFQKYDINQTGAAIYLPGEPVFEKDYSEDSSELFTCQMDFADVTYGAIIVKFAEPLGSDTTVWEELLLSYMQFLNSSAFMLTNAVDPGYGRTLESHPSARGILIYGEDADKKQYAIKGWVDENFIAVLYVYSMEEMNYNIQSLFLNGFRFPEK